MKILIIGGCGFIGFNVFSFLSNKGYSKTTIIDIFLGQSSKKNYLKIKKEFKNINFLNIDANK